MRSWGDRGGGSRGWQAGPGRRRVGACAIGLSTRLGGTEGRRVFQCTDVPNLRLWRHRDRRMSSRFPALIGSGLQQQACARSSARTCYGCRGGSEARRRRSRTPDAGVADPVHRCQMAEPARANAGSTQPGRGSRPRNRITARAIRRRSRDSEGKRKARRARSALGQAELVEQAVELVERSEGDRDLALLATRGAFLHAHFDFRGQCVRQFLLDAQQIA